MRKKVLIICTGGTIGMTFTWQGYVPLPQGMMTVLRKILSREAHKLPEYDVIELQPQVDSSDMTPDVWNKIVEIVESKYDLFDGFVILHGTDTMSYTASALSFMFENLGKPVIVTGSQVPLEQIANDARANLVTSMLLAGNYNIPEVCVYFHGKLLRGNRSKKVNNFSFDAFASPNYPPLGEVGMEIKIFENLLRNHDDKLFKCVRMKNAAIGVVSLFPGVSMDWLELVMTANLQAIVIKTYGAGNAMQNPSILKLIATASKKGVLILNCSQCFIGGVRMDKYVSGHSLGVSGVISCGDMTIEAVVAKLYYLFSLGIDSVMLKERIFQDLRGELST